MGIKPGSQGSTTLSDGTEVQMPLLTYAARTFAAFFTISAGKARALLPSDELRPVRISPRRALIMVQAMEYTDKNIEPYREFAFSIPVRRSSYPDIPGLSFVNWLTGDGSASYITHLAVDTAQALLIGWEILGFPKFIAEIELSESGTERIAEATLDGESIFAFAVAKTSSQKEQQRDFSIYSLSPEENKLFEIPYQSATTVGTKLGASSARLHLGSHPVADELRDLDIAPVPVLALDIPQYTLISNRPTAKIDVGDWRDPRGVYRELRAAGRAETPGATTSSGIRTRRASRSSAYGRSGTDRADV
ncbi:MAG: acetoacetate decarboxylase family protein [Thermoleophilaceae bacterium]|nr:acetoacetate decarboxylase family protein [Thermoleophilaceae bacterium]